MFRAYPEYSEGGFADRRTVVAGEEITFYLGNALPTFPARILRVSHDSLATSPTNVLSLDRLRGNSPALDCGPQTGCEWNPSYSLTIPADWPSGWYRLAFPVSYSTDERYIDFIVAEPKPMSDVLFIFDTQTADAYNVYGGGSLYGRFNQEGRWFRHEPFDQASFRRPVVRSHTYDCFAQRIQPPQLQPHEEEYFRLRLESWFRVAYVSNCSLQSFGLEYLQQYPVIVIVGTQEYWSHDQMRLLQDYVLQGGALYLSAAEFGYGAIRLEHDGEVIRFFLNPADDPLFRSAPENVATVRTLVWRQEDFFGVSLQVGQGLGSNDQFSPLTVAWSRHPTFEGLGFSDGDPIAGVKGLAPGAWIETSSGGGLHVASSAIPSEQIDVLATAAHPPLTEWAGPESSFCPSRPSYSRVSEIPEHTYAVLALVRQGRGTMFVGPGGWFNSPHPYNTDPRVPQLIQNVIKGLIDRRFD